MSDSQSINTSLLEVLVSSKNECVLICNLSDHTFHFIFDAWWGSINVGSKRPLEWSKSRRALLWNFYLHCGIEDTGSPGIICIVCHQVHRHPSEHGTSSMGKHLMAKVHITKLNEFTESEVSQLTRTTIDETAWAILQRQGSCGITIVSSQKKLIFNSEILFILTRLISRPLWTGSKGLSNCRISPRFPESLPHVRMCFGSHSMECYIKPRAATVIWGIMRQASAAIRQQPYQHLQDRILTDSWSN